MSTALPPGAALPAGAGGDGVAAGAPAAGGWSLSSILRMLVFWYFISSYFKGNKTPAPTTDVSTGVVHQPHRPMWADQTVYDMYVYVHHLPELNLNEFTAHELNPSRLVWQENDLVFGSWDGRTAERALNWTFTDESWMMQHLQANGTLYAHAFFVRDRSNLFKYRGKQEREEVRGGAPDALVLSEDGTSLALAHSSKDLTPIPAPTSEGFDQKYVKNARYQPNNIVHRFMELNIYRPAPKIVDKKNLLGVGEKANVSSEVAIPEKKTEPEPVDEEDEEEIMEFEDDDEFESGSVATQQQKNKGVVKSKTKKGKVVPWLSYWKPFLSIRLVPDFTVFPYRGIPDEMKDDYIIDPSTDQYAPIVYFDYFWLLTDQLIIVNNTVSSLSLNMTHSPLSLLKWRMELQMETSWKMQQSWGMQEEDGRESEMFKKMVLETNVYLLAITFVVSLLHMVFDFLAFKNDVHFWKNAKTMRGLSTRSILMNSVCQAIIFLYLLDNDTSYMILFSSGIGVAIEVWKVQKALVITIDRTRPFPYIRIQNKNLSEDKPEDEKTEDEKELELHAKYDGEAMTYLSYVLYPLLLCYAGYSLYYESHKSWYSFILAVLTGCVYTFGFIMMCPQLYMNYKLKSVAHLPWRMLTYKALNTFIDDLFAFVITMPTLHRLSCFRDDIIFFIFLYQKWIYRVDYKRVNEFGTVLISEEEQKKMEEEARAIALAKLNDDAEVKPTGGAFIEEITEEEAKKTESITPSPVATNATLVESESAPSTSTVDASTLESTNSTSDSNTTSQSVAADIVTADSAPSSSKDEQEVRKRHKSKRAD